MFRIYDAFNVSTYQAASALGCCNRPNWNFSKRQVLAGETPTVNKFPYQLAFNVFLK
jgi:aspartate-semialdehyde dehydrogenase